MPPAPRQRLALPGGLGRFISCDPIPTSAYAIPSPALQREVSRRRSFAIISHPDAGKTTLTETFLLYGGTLNLAGYAPQDEKIALTALRAIATQLDALNLTIPQVAQSLTDAIADRDQAAFGHAGLKAVFDGVKTSVKGQYGQTSRQYTTVSGIKW